MKAMQMQEHPSPQRRPGVTGAESRFLGSLSLDLQKRLAPALEQVNLLRGEGLHQAGETIDYVYFPISCMVSMVVSIESGNMIEATTVGNDGYVPVSAFFGGDRADVTAIVQMSGEALRMKIDDFRRELDYPEFRRALGAYSAKTLQTTGQSIACIAFHPLQERLARWLLTVRDATERDEMPLTQDFLAVMLGVHRPTVTIAIRILESAGLIEHRRGLIRIVDADALANSACECYHVLNGSRLAAERRL
jgi:CRP-like cAMP-binding protein